MYLLPTITYHYHDVECWTNLVSHAAPHRASWINFVRAHCMEWEKSRDFLSWPLCQTERVDKLNGPDDTWFDRVDHPCHRWALLALFVSFGIVGNRAGMGSTESRYYLGDRCFHYYYIPVGMLAVHCTKMNEPGISSVCFSPSG